MTDQEVLNTRSSCQHRKPVDSLEIPGHPGCPGVTGLTFLHVPTFGLFPDQVVNLELDQLLAVRSNTYKALKQLLGGI